MVKTINTGHFYYPVQSTIRHSAPAAKPSARVVCFESNVLRRTGICADDRRYVLYPRPSVPSIRAMINIMLMSWRGRGERIYVSALSCAMYAGFCTFAGLRFFFCVYVCMHVCVGAQRAGIRLAPATPPPLSSLHPHPNWRIRHQGVLLLDQSDVICFLFQTPYCGVKPEPGPQTHI